MDVRRQGVRPVRQRTLAALAVALAWFSGGANATAQSEDCEVLRQQMASSDNTGRVAGSVRAAQRQQAEISRTQAYADQIGCGSGFSLFSDAQPGQCDAIESRIQQMESNLNELTSQIESLRNGDPERRADLDSRYNAACNTDTGGSHELNGWDDLRSGFSDQDDGGQGDPDAPRSHAGKAICVRTCDGGFFPLGAAPSDSGADGLQSLCTALCPNTEAKLYTTPNTDDLDAAVAVDGTSYTALPAAFRFQKSFDPTCACKPPDQTWVQALAQAETLLEKGEKDVTVTSQMSDQMSRAAPSTPVSGRKTSKVKSLIDTQAVAEGALAAQAPTAGSESAGIGNRPTDANRLIKTDEGAVKEMAGPDGAKRRVRIIEPLL